MNPRPILITSIIAVLFVAAAYFVGQHVFETGHAEETRPPTMSKLKGQVDSATEPMAHPSETPATDTPNNEQQPSVTEQPAPTVDNEMDNTPQDAEIPETTETEDELVSPHGFGPYPKIPEGAPIGSFSNRDPVDMELLGRVMVKSGQAFR